MKRFAIIAAIASVGGGASWLFLSSEPAVPIPAIVEARLEHVLPATPPQPPPPPPPPPPRPSRAQLDHYIQVLAEAKDEYDGVHDACVYLYEFGNDASVPHLIRALRLIPDVEPKMMVCTWSHCVETLQHITGEKMGYSYTAWQKWWNLNHPGETLPGLPNPPLQPTGQGAGRRLKGNRYTDKRVK